MFYVGLLVGMWLGLCMMTLVPTWFGNALGLVWLSWYIYFKRPGQRWLCPRNVNSRNTTPSHVAIHGNACPTNRSLHDVIHVESKEEEVVVSWLIERVLSLMDEEADADDIRMRSTNQSMTTLSRGSS